MIHIKTQRGQIDNNILLLPVIIVDTVTRIMSEIQYTLDDPTEYVRVSKWIGFFIPLAVYILASVVAIAFNLLLLCHGKNCWPSLREWVDLFTKLVTITGGILYIVGNNLESLVEGNTTFASLAITVLAIAMYRYFRLALEWLQDYCKETSRKLGYFNRWSPNSDTETNSFLVVYTTLLTFVLDFNIFFGIFLRTLDTSQRLCNRLDQVGAIRFFYASGIGTFCITQVIIMAIFYYATFTKKGRDDDAITVNLSNVYQKKGCFRCCCIAWDIVLSVMVAVAVAFYLAADNHEFLECHLSHLEGAITRIILLSLALVVFLIVFIGFWVRKEGHCVQVKGKFEELSIEVMNNNERKIEMVFSENHTITHTIPPPLPPNSPKPNYNGCNENLYKDDFKGIIDYVKGQVTVHARTCMDDKCTCTYDAQHVMNCLQGINRAVGIRKLDNKVVMVYWIVENTSTTAVNHVYLVVQSTTDPAIHVYKVTEGLNNLSKCVKEENVEEPLLTYKYNNKEYEIYLYRHEDRKKMKFAVQIETPTP